MGFENRRKINGDHFFIQKSIRSDIGLDYYIDRINFNDYYIYKSPRTIKEVTIEEFKEFKYAGYIFFHKELYSNIEMNKSIGYLYSKRLSFNYFNKPLPPLNILQKIKVIDGVY